MGALVGARRSRCRVLPRRWCGGSRRCRASCGRSTSKASDRPKGSDGSASRPKPLVVTSSLFHIFLSPCSLLSLTLPLSAINTSLEVFFMFSLHHHAPLGRFAYLLYPSSIHLSIYLSVHPSIYLFFHPSSCRSVVLCFAQTLKGKLFLNPSCHSLSASLFFFSPFLLVRENPITRLSLSRCGHPHGHRHRPHHNQFDARPWPLFFFLDSAEATSL